MTDFITADLHYHHKNICRGTSEWDDKSGCRDYNTLEEMDYEIVSSINNIVKENDTLRVLGDWSFGGYNKVKELRDRILCKNIHLIYGNHDHHIIKHIELQKLFLSCKFYDEFVLNHKMFVLSHYSFRVWNRSHRGSINLYGHSHGTLKPYGRSLDCGWDVFRKPITFLEAADIAEKNSIEFPDHHNVSTNY